MADQSPDSEFLKNVGPVLFSAVSAALLWLTGASGHLTGALTTALAVIGGICALAFSLMYRRYLGVLASGGARKGSPARAAYDALRESLSGENVAARIYSKGLHTLLDGIERFVGDVGMADRTLFPHAFGLKTPAPLWTAPAFNRCLLLGLIYPIATIFLIWAISGHVGPAESALGLKAGTSGWRRASGVAMIFLSSNPISRSYRAEGWFKTLAWLAVGVYIAAAGAGIAGAHGIAVGATLAFASAFTGADAGTFGGAVAVAGTFSFAIILAGVFSGGYGGGFAGGLAFSGAVKFINDLAIVRQQYGRFLPVFIVTMISLCMGFPVIVASSPAWKEAGPLLLFVGLLTLINAPFDWASLGLTRALLRRGLELGAWWPYFLALIDAALAAVIITVLAVTMVVGVQTFDAVAVHSGGTPVLPLRELFDGVTARPSEPEYWWLYALLISSMIPSMLNLAIGGVAFVRGVPGLRSLVLGFLPAGKAVPLFDRDWIALVLTTQTSVGIFLGVAAQAFLAIGVIGYLLPWLGLHILDVARDIADFNLPERVWALFNS